MNILQANGFPAFMHRFQNFYDSTVTAVGIHHARNRSNSSVTVSIGALDHSVSPASHVLLVMRFSGSPEFTIRELDRVSYATPGDGARIQEFNRRIFLDLDSLDGDEDTISSYRASNFYVAADHCSWDTQKWTV